MAGMMEKLAGLFRGKKKTDSKDLRTKETKYVEAELAKAGIYNTNMISPGVRPEPKKEPAASAAAAKPAAVMVDKKSGKSSAEMLEELKRSKKKNEATLAYLKSLKKK